MKYPIHLVIVFLIGLVSCTNEGPYLTIGLVADPQYAVKESLGKRNYKESVWKLEEAIKTFNEEKVDMVQNLGDIIDIHWESFDSILPPYQKLDHDIENYHLLGNHEFSIDSVHMKDLVSRLNMPDYYYSYSVAGWRFMVLDATEIAYYSNPLHQRDKDELDKYYDKIEGKPNQQTWNSAIGEIQQEWIKKELENVENLNQKVIIYSHLPVRHNEYAHNLWNDYEIVDLINHSERVFAFINGHNHEGAYDFHQGVHYITVVGMVETMVSSYGILEFYQDSLILHGYGNQETIHLNFE